MERIGPYEILGELGRGGMGVVYHARRADLDREFALKIIAADALAADPLLHARFLREGQAAAALAGHPGIIAVHDVGEHHGAPYLAMDYVPGESLDTILRDDAPPPRRCAELIAATARAVHHAHGHGVMHRDLKPANIMVTPAGEPRVADYGLAKLINAGAELTRLTQSNTVVGTPAYMPPEQARGEPIDARSDVYALGATLYDACAGGPPFDGSSIFNIISKVLREPPPPLRRRNPAVEPVLAAIVGRCLEKAPDDRYPSAEALAQDLEAWLAGRPTVAQPIGLVRRAWRVVRRHPSAAAAAALTLAVCGTVGGWLVLRDSGESGLKQAEAHVEQLSLAAQLDLAWVELVDTTLPDVTLLERRWYGASIPDETAGAALKRIEVAAATVGRRYDRARLPRAWAAYARFLHDEQSNPDALAESIRAEGGTEDPYPLLLLARARLHRFTWRAMGLDIGNMGRQLRVVQFRQTEDVRTLREQSAKEIAAALRQPIWRELRQGGELIRFMQAADALTRKEWAEAQSLAAALVDEPVVGGAAPLMYAVTLFYQGRLTEAAEVWTQAGRAGWTDALASAAECHLALSYHEDAKTGDPRPVLDRAIALADEGLAQSPGRLRLVMVRGHAYLERGIATRRLGADPGPELDQAETVFTALQDAPGWERSAINFRGLARHARAEWETDNGRDPTRWARAAIADFTTAEGGHGDYASALVNRAVTRRVLADHAAATGGDAFGHLRAAREDLTRAVDASPHARVVVLINRANFALVEAELTLAAGEDSQRLLTEAADDLAVVAGVEPDNPDIKFSQGHHAMQIADRAKKFGEPTILHYDRAIALYEAAIATGPPAADRHATLGSARWERAIARFTETGVPQADDLDAALVDFDRALTLNARDLSAYVNRALVRKDRVRQGLEADPIQGLKAALDDFTRALALTPGHPDTLFNQAVTVGMLGDYVAAGGGDALPHYRESESGLGAVLKVQPNRAGAYGARAAVRVNLAHTLGEQGADSRSAIGGALEDFAAAARLDPDDWMARANRAQLFMMLQRWSDAATELEAALTIHPTHAKLRELHAYAKRQAGK